MSKKPDHETIDELLILSRNLLADLDTSHTVDKKASAKKESSNKRDILPESLREEIALKAEELRREKRKKAAVFSFLKASAVLTLFLALGLLQQSLRFYLFLVILACVVLGFTSYMERK